MKTKTICAAVIGISGTKKWREAGFTLIEILAVVAIMTALTLVAIPSIGSIDKARRMGRAVHDLSDFLQLARYGAISRQTYVWVGARNVTIEGQYNVQLMAVYSLDATSSNVTPANLRPLLKTLQVPGMRLCQWSNLKSTTQELLGQGTPESIASNTNGIQFTVGPAAYTETLTFTPKGEVLLKGAPTAYDGYNELIDISLQQTNGITVPAGGEDAAVVLAGATGVPKIIRIH